METLYEVAARVVLSGWAALAIALFFSGARKPLFLYAGFVLPGAIAVAYIATLIVVFANPPEIGDLSTLPGYKSVLAHDGAAVATWLHILAFDLFFGAWALRDGLERGIGRVWLVAVLAIALVAGPVALLAYLLLRIAHAARTCTGARAPDDTL